MVESEPEISIRHTVHNNGTTDLLLTGQSHHNGYRISYEQLKEMDASSQARKWGYQNDKQENTMLKIDSAA